MFIYIDSTIFVKSGSWMTVVKVTIYTLPRSMSESDQTKFPGTSKTSDYLAEVEQHQTECMITSPWILLAFKCLTYLVQSNLASNNVSFGPCWVCTCKGLDTIYQQNFLERPLNGFKIWWHLDTYVCEKPQFFWPKKKGLEGPKGVDGPNYPP